jgi:signal transduction histidine kinase
MIRGEAGRLQDLVSAFLDLERLGAGQWDTEVEVLDLGSLTTGRLEILRASAQTKGQTITFSDDVVCHVRGVANLLERVVDNLVGNAIKYSEEGSRIEVTIEQRANRALLSIRDRGPGIPPDALARLGERFYRVPGTSQPGAGLGLALVHEITHWHGGCITIDSELGVGSTFTADLPACEED